MFLLTILPYIVLVLSYMSTVESYSYVVPQMACFSLKPEHNSSAQLTTPPFKVSIGTKYYHPNDLVKVTINSDTQIHFSGFMLQARLVKTNHIVGTWSFDQTAYPYIGVMKCLDKNNTLVNAWPQTNEFKNAYFTNITVFWVAPDIDNWDVEFVTTVVESYKTYWTDVKSDLLISTSRLDKNGTARKTAISYQSHILLFLILIIVF